MPTAFDTPHFKHVLAQFATGVTVITTRLDKTTFLGLTINSFNAVSLDPPLILWSLDNLSKNLQTFLDQPHYVVNILAANQVELAEKFSKRVATQFDNLEFTLSPSGLPILKGATAWLDCQHETHYPGGDHTIFLGRVNHCSYSHGSALLFHNRKFGHT